MDKTYTQIRIRRDLYKKLNKEAKKSKRSTTSYLEFLLEGFFDKT